MSRSGLDRTDVTTQISPWERVTEIDLGVMIVTCAIANGGVRWTSSVGDEGDARDLHHAVFKATTAYMRREWKRLNPPDRPDALAYRLKELDTVLEVFSGEPGVKAQHVLDYIDATAAKLRDKLEAAG